MWAWIFDGRDEKTRRASGWSGTMSLPRVLSPAPDGSVEITVPEELEMLRYQERELKGIELSDGGMLPVEEIRGDSVELDLVFAPSAANRLGVAVCRSPAGEEETRIFYDAIEKRLTIDTRKSGPDEEAHGPGIQGVRLEKVESAPFTLGEGEPLALRIFVDRSVVEVFANDRQAVMRRIYPDREDSLGVALFAEGEEATVRRLKAWKMAASNPY